MIDGATCVFAILGNPVAHSLSPAMHNAAFKALGLRAVYVPMSCSRDDVTPLIQALRRSGGGGNVTVPYKEAAARAVDAGSELVGIMDACNTFWGENGGSAGDNTDVHGVLQALRELQAPRAPWLIAGTGGGARAAVIAAGACKAGVAVMSRDERRRGEFENWISTRGVSLVAPADCGVVINATPLGLRDEDPLPIALDAAPRAEVALDMVYAAGETRWVRSIRSRVRRAGDGRVMLVAQGAASFERWFPDRHAPVEIMRAAVNAALR